MKEQIFKCMFQGFLRYIPFLELVLNKAQLPV